MVRGSNVFWVLHPRRDVAFALQHMPYIDMVRALDVDDEVGVAPQRLEAQSDQVQRVGVARRASCWMSPDLHIGQL